MVRKLIPAISFFFFGNIALAQKVAELSLDYDDPKFGKKQNSAWLNYSGNSKQFLLSVIEKDEVNHILLNESMAVSDSFSEVRETMADYVEPYFYPKYLAKKNTLYGKQFKRIAVVRDDSLSYIAMFSGEKNQGLYFHRIDFSSKTSAFIISWLPGEEEKLVGYYQLNGKLCWATLWGKKKDKQLRFYELKGDKTISYKSTGLVFKQVDLSEFKTEKLLADMALIDYSEYPDNYEASRKIKIYPTPKGIFLTLNGRSPVTTLAFIDTESGLVNERQFDHSIGNISIEKIENSCSFKYGDLLFLLSTSADKIFTSIIDLETGKIEKESTADFEQKVVRRGVSASAKDYGKQLKAFFDLLNKGDLFIKVKETGQDMEVNIGSVAPAKYPAGAGDPLQVRVPVSNGLWTSWITTRGPVNLVSNIEKSVTIAFATTRVNTLNFEVQETTGVSDDINKQSRIDYFITGTRDPKGVAICKTGDIFYVGLYAKATGKYAIHKF